MAFRYLTLINLPLPFTLPTKALEFIFQVRYQQCGPPNLANFVMALDTKK